MDFGIFHCQKYVQTSTERIGGNTKISGSDQLHQRYPIPLHDLGPSQSLLGNHSSHISDKCLLDHHWCKKNIFFFEKINISQRKKIKLCVCMSVSVHGRLFVSSTFEWICLCGLLLLSQWFTSCFLDFQGVGQDQRKAKSHSILSSSIYQVQILLVSPKIILSLTKLF